MNEAVAIASEFLDGGVVYRQRDAGGKESQTDVTDGGIARSIPLVVLSGLWAEARPAIVVVLALAGLLVLVVHELLHAIIFPNFPGNPAILVGAWPRRLLFFAHYQGELTRNRFLVVFAMPTVVITILPLLAAVTGALPVSVLKPAAWLSVWNAAFACGDYIGFTLVLFQIPGNGICRNHGWRTYWKPASLVAGD